MVISTRRKRNLRSLMLVIRRALREYKRVLLSELDKEIQARELDLQASVAVREASLAVGPAWVVDAQAGQGTRPDDYEQQEGH